MYWIGLVQERACAYGNVLSVSIKCRKFLTSEGPVSFSGRTLLRGVSLLVSYTLRTRDFEGQRVKLPSQNGPILIINFNISAGSVPNLTCKGAKKVIK
jgi:hypothetical protein